MRPGGFHTKKMAMPLDTEQEISDEALLTLYANGDASAARSLTLRLTPRVLGQAYRMLGNRAEAEDVAQEALMRLWKIAPDWRSGEAKVTTWLYRVTANLCTDRLRRKPSVPLDGAPEPPDPADSAEQVLQSRARSIALHQALLRLPERQREAVMLRHLEDLGNPAIAEIMEISVEAVESLLSRGKRGLHDALSRQKAALGFEGET